MYINDAHKHCTIMKKKIVVRQNIVRGFPVSHPVVCNGQDTISPTYLFKYCLWLIIIALIYGAYRISDLVMDLIGSVHNDEM